MFFGQDNGLLPELFRQSGTFVGLLAAPEIKLVTRLDFTNSEVETVEMYLAIINYEVCRYEARSQ